MTAKHKPAAPAGPAYRLSSVDHALELLLLFRSRPALRVSEVAEQLDVARSTAHRLLGMLVHRQFAVQDPATRTYRPGPRLVEIGLAAVGALDIRTRMRPYLTEVAARTGETVSLLVLEGDAVHFIDSIESQRTVRVGSRFDARMPAHATSAGKAILAALPADEVLAIYPNEKLPTVTERTLTTRAQLLAIAGPGARRRLRRQPGGDRDRSRRRRHGGAGRRQPARGRVHRRLPDAADDARVRGGARGGAPRQRRGGERGAAQVSYR